MTSIPVKQFYMVRHGESEANAAGIYSGQMDTPLTPLGQAQAKKVAELLRQKKVKPATIIHSDLQRARYTAAPMAEVLGLSPVTVPDWAEQHIGIWSGRPHEEVRSLRMAGIEPPEGETNTAFVSRIAAAAAHSLMAYEVPLVVCHGGCFRALAEHYGLTVSGIKNCRLYEFVPSSPNAAFPWQVFVYDTESGEKTVAPEFIPSV